MNFPVLSHDNRDIEVETVSQRTTSTARNKKGPAIGGAFLVYDEEVGTMQTQCEAREFDYPVGQRNK